MFEKLKYKSIAVFYLSIALIALSSCKDFSETGLKSFENEDYKKALKSFEEALARDPNNESLHYNLARTFEELGKYKEGIAKYDKICHI